MIKLSKEQIESIEKVAAESAEHRAAMIAYGAQRHYAGMLYGSVPLLFCTKITISILRE